MDQAIGRPGALSSPVTRAAVGVLLAALVASAASPARSGFGGLFEHWIYGTLVAGSAALCVTRAVRLRDGRAGWALLGAGLAASAAAAFAATIWPSHPSAADALRTVSYPACAAALPLLVRARTRGGRRGRLLLDGTLAALATGAVAEALVFAPVLTSERGTAIERIAHAAYPIGALTLLALTAAFTTTGRRAGRAWLVLTAGLLAMLAAACVEAYHPGTRAPGEALDALAAGGALLLGIAAWMPDTGPASSRPPGAHLPYLPGAFALAALGVLVYDHFSTRVDTLAAVLAAMTVAVAIVRTGVSFGDNKRMLDFTRREALTDPLTGLGNRRSLMVDLVTEADSATRERPLALALFDLDGFKGYNDRFGHPAGDALLARLGRNLVSALGPGGRAYRLGGDEFCVLLQAGPDEAAPSLEAATAALSDRESECAIGSSHGAVFIPTDTSNAMLAMEIADRRLYGNKGSRRRPEAETGETLARMLQASQPELHQHLHEVARLSLAVGRRMELRRDALDQMARAAELHDVGKVAIPEDILNKPGPLDAIEWGVVRQHTIVGERILATAPALSPLARVVRASHENFDGSGYPDGLAGEQIPLASRIISACDAYHAMTSERPYQAAVAHGQAVAELRRCAGSRFDPVVVEMLCAELDWAEENRPAELDEAGLDPRLLIYGADEVVGL